MAVKAIAEWGLNDAKEQAERDLPPDYEINRKLIEEKDHWQDGKLWPGHRTGDPATDAAIRKNIEPQFVSDDVLGEATDNRSSAMVGQEADIALVALTVEGDGDIAEADPAEGEEIEAGDTEAAEVEAVIGALHTWWDRAGLWPAMRQVIDRITYAGRASIRAYVPAGRLLNDVLPTVPTLAEALGNIEIDAPAPKLANRYVDPLTANVSAIVITKIDDKESAEVWTTDPLTGQTELRILGEGARTLGPYDLKGRLPLAVAKGQRLLTPSVRSLQAQLNFIATVVTRTVESAGHRDRYLGNVDPPGMWLPTPPVIGPALEIDESNPAQTYWKHRVPWMVGANITTELIGLPETTRDAEGNERVGYATPFVQSLDPVDPAYATNAAAVVTRRLYQRFKQGHLGGEATAESSGVAYQQARAQFETDLNGLRSPVELMLRDLIEAVLALAGLMHPASAGLLDRFRVAATLHPQPGPVSEGEVRLAVELRDKRAISQETMQSRIGVEDTLAEQESIDHDPSQQAALWKVIVASLNELMALPDMTLAGAGFLLGLTPEQLTVLATGLPPEGETEGLPPEALEAPTPIAEDAGVEGGTSVVMKGKPPVGMKGKPPVMRGGKPLRIGRQA